MEGPLKAIVALDDNALTARLAGLHPYDDVAKPDIDIRTFSRTTKTGRSITSCSFSAYRSDRSLVSDTIDRCLRLDMLPTALILVETVTDN